MDDPKTKGFLERPEGKTGLLFGAALLAGAGVGLYYLLPFIIVLLTNTLYALALAAGVGAVIYLASDKRFRALLGYMYKSVMRWITGKIIEIDPIGILKGYSDDLHKQLETMLKSMGNLEGQIRKLKTIIGKNEENRKHSLELAGQAKKKDVKSAFILQSRQAGRLEKSNITLQSLLTKMEMLDKVLKKMYETSQFLVQDIEGEIEVKAQERAAIQASYSAFTAAKKIIAGDSDQKAIFDQAMEKLADDYALKIGEIETFMEVSEGFIQSVDLENGIYEADALAKLEQWEKKTDQLLEGPATRIAMEPSKMRVEKPEEPNGVDDDSRSSFADLFDNKHN